MRQFVLPAAVALVALAMAATAFAFLAPSVGALVVFLAPFIAALMVLTLPGYAVFAAISPRAGLAASDGILFSLGLSFIATALGAIVLNLTPLGVVPIGWRLLLGGVTAVGLILFVMRGRRQDSRPSAPNIEPWPTLLLGVAIIIVVGAGVVARAGADGDPSSGVTQLWMLPTPADTAKLELGLRSGDGGRYRVEIWRGARKTRAWPLISLSPGQVWRRTIAVPAGKGPVEARVSSSDAPGGVMRVVAVTPLNDLGGSQRP